MVWSDAQRTENRIDQIVGPVHECTDHPPVSRTVSTEARNRRIQTATELNDSATPEWVGRGYLWLDPPAETLLPEEW